MPPTTAQPMPPSDPQGSSSRLTPQFGEFGAPVPLTVPLDFSDVDTAQMARREVLPERMRHLVAWASDHERAAREKRQAAHEAGERIDALLRTHALVEAEYVRIQTGMQWVAQTPQQALQHRTWREHWMPRFEWLGTQLSGLNQELAHLRQEWSACVEEGKQHERAAHALRLAAAAEGRALW